MENKGMWIWIICIIAVVMLAIWAYLTYFQPLDGVPNGTLVWREMVP